MWKKISLLGVNDQLDVDEKKQLIILNRINSILVSIFLLITLIDIIETTYHHDKYGAGFYRMLLIVLTCSFHLYLNYIRRYRWSRILLIIDLPFLILFFPTLLGNVHDEYYFWYPFVPIALSIIPHFVFTKEKEIKWVYLSLFAYLLITVSIDEVLNVFAPDKLAISSIIEANYLYYRFGPAMIFVFVNASLIYAFKLNRIQQTQLGENNSLLSMQQEELKSQNEELKAVNEGVVSKQLEIEKVNAKLTNTNATKELLIRIIGHDLRGPISQLSVFADVMIDHFDDLTPDILKKNLKEISNSSGNSAKLLENLIEWSKLQSGKLVPKPEKLSIKELTDENIKLLINKTKNKEIKIYNRIDSHVEAMVDRNMINTVLRNLISNALKFTHKKGKIEISAKKANNHIEISVSDNGVGMNKEDKDNIFRIELQKSTLGTQNEKGTGFGLILCKEFIERHKGTIWVESEKNEGSVFRFSLPDFLEN